VTASTRAAPAADCTGKPTAQSPPGQHWYYRTDRATHRQCWYLAAQGSDVQRGATASARTRPAAPQRAHRPTAAAPETTRAGAPEPTRVASVGQANVPAPAAPEPAEAAKLPDAPPASEPAPQPELAEASQSADVIDDPAPAPATSRAEEPKPPVKAQSSRVAAAVQAAANADQPSPWIVVPLLLLAMVAPMYYAARWLRRRMASARLDLGELLPATAYVRACTSPDSDSETAVRHISQPKALEQAEKEVAQALQQLLSGTETKQYAETLDQTEKLAQELQQLLNEAQIKQAKPLDQTEQLVQALNVVRSRVSDPVEPTHAQPAPAADEALRSRDLLLANQGN